ncbi:MAG: ribonuclease P protein subunit [Desulfurococcaceae archaeon]
MTPYITRRNLQYHEIIGLRVRVLQYSDPQLVGLEGVVVDETLKTLVVEKHGGARIRVFKSQAVFEFKLPSGEAAVIRGDNLIGRPWDRLKKVLISRR